MGLVEGKGREEGGMEGGGSTGCSLCGLEGGRLDGAGG